MLGNTAAGIGWETQLRERHLSSMSSLANQRLALHEKNLQVDLFVIFDYLCFLVRIAFDVNVSREFLLLWFVFI